MEHRFAPRGFSPASVSVMPWDSETEGITVPTLVICGASDAVNTCNGHGQPTYDGISNSVDKMIVVIASGPDGLPSADGGASGRYALAFMKLFLEGDERWRALLLAAPNDGTTLQ